MARTLPDTTIEKNAFSDMLAIVAGLFAAGYGLYLAFNSHDEAMAFHGLLLAASAGVAVACVLNVGFGQPETTPIADYQDGPIKVATIAAVIWGIAGFLVGDIIAWQLAFPSLNLDLPWTSFGRLRPLHTSAVIFAFGGNVLIATSFYVVQRTCHARLAGRWSLVALVRRVGLSAVHRHRRHGLCARHHPGQGIRRT